jgi:hypothetical protein
LASLEPRFIGFAQDFYRIDPLDFFWFSRAPLIHRIGKTI